MIRKYDWLRDQLQADEKREKAIDAEFEVSKQAKMKPWEWLTLLTRNKTLITDPTSLHDFEPWIVVHMLGSNEDYIEVAAKIAIMRLPKEAVYLYLHDVLPNSFIQTEMHRVQSMDPVAKKRMSIVSEHFEIGSRDAADMISFHGEELIDAEICSLYPEVWEDKKKKPKAKKGKR